MTSLPLPDRHSLRREILTQRNLLSAAEVAQKSGRIRANLAILPEIMAAQTLFVYVNFRSEVQIMPLITAWLAQGKTVLVPLTLVAESRLRAVRITDPASQLRPGYCNIPEPVAEHPEVEEVAPERIEVVIMPGAVFDPRGGRLGYGGGYYDRFLAVSAPRARRIALAFALQMVERVPLEPHDQVLDLIVTEDQIYECRKMRHAENSCLSR